MSLLTSTIVSWMVLRARSDADKDFEILTLRHQIAVLHRHAARPRMCRADWALISGLARTPSRRRIGLIAAPATILRWHRFPRRDPMVMARSLLGLVVSVWRWYRPTEPAQQPR
jgi:hypothetical protein